MLRAVGQRVLPHRLVARPEGLPAAQLVGVVAPEVMATVVRVDPVVRAVQAALVTAGLVVRVVQEEPVGVVTAGMVTRP